MTIDLEKLTNLQQKIRRAGKLAIIHPDAVKGFAEELDSIINPAPLTMAEIEWDHDTHYLAEADTKRYGKVVMIREFDGYIGIHMLADHYVAKFDTMNPVALTPTGRKYKLVPESEILPALPEGFRLADHKKYGRVVVSPKADEDGDYRVSFSRAHLTYGDGWHYVTESELTFLEWGAK